ncbi:MULTISPECIES: N-acetyltransferase [unclassified Cryobacterium]|uniref:GNAT family N-acetyltransferase n=1 Tax=unclassified Cryobacterium TaxID=2649013 RepID=UPI00106CF787|nr:GNAT family N-acetyltransferase [Cryobacterium sp. MDB2-A-1]TFC02246.1 GNAT family N-acetyltransferase [Cryobacterium sp. MDB2-33-2]TFC09963.1 GNAT family N-acetyltransferase [Cryobacterium sp. MDB2-A-2]TFC22141.1 GNAT family N-acetyltransferase [Cryobacterium sp. MDB2-10]
MQGAGTGEALVRAAIDEARAWGVSAVVLDTGSLNERAQRLRAGFHRLQDRAIPTAARRTTGCPSRLARARHGGCPGPRARCSPVTHRHAPSRTVTTCRGDDPGRAASAVFVRWSDD